MPYEVVAQCHRHIRFQIVVPEVGRGGIYLNWRIQNILQPLLNG